MFFFTNSLAYFSIAALYLGSISGVTNGIHEISMLVMYVLLAINDLKDRH